MKITEVALGFPVNQTIVADFGHYADALTHKDGCRYNYKLILHLTEEERKMVTEQAVADGFKANNPQAASVKVVFDVQRSQHIRSPEIIKAKTNADKLAEYMKVNGLKAPGAIYGTLKDIEDNLEVRYLHPRHSFTLLKVGLRGSIGLHEKSGKEEYELDFRSYPRGIIALTGAVGHGKTTLIENCHPYPQMLTRSGKLQDHFYLRDSYRQLLYVDEEGTYYDIDMQIDGKTKNGKVKAFVKTGKDMSNLEPVAECDGNADSYAKWVNGTFGSMELYLRTAFYTRGKTGSIPDIAYATKGEKKALFSTLIGIEGLSDISLAAREKAKLVGREVEKLGARVVDLDEYESVESIDGKIDELNGYIAGLDGQIQKTMKDMADLEKELVDDAADKIKALEKQRDDLTDRKIDLEQDIEFVRNYNDNSETYDKLGDLYAEASAANNEYLDYKENALEPLAADHNSLLSELAGMERECAVLKARKEALEENIVDGIKDTCPTCGQRLPEDKVRELSAALLADKSRLAEMSARLGDMENGLNDLRRKEEQHGYHAAEKKLSELCARKSSLSDEIEALGAGISENDLKEIRSRYRSIKSPETLPGRLKEIDGQIGALAADIDALSKLDGSGTKARIARCRDELAGYERRKKECLIETGSLKEQKNTLLEAEKQNRVLERQIEEKKSLEAQYDVLEKAFGANGIQALELEALSPEIADFTNDVLETVFGGEYKVSFRTLREGSNGNLIEDFNILVETVSTGTVRPLEWVSGGEGTIIKEALFNAFGIARQRSCGVSFRTKFADEMDSAIDPDFRPKYLQMVRSVHDLSGTEHTVMITHSSEVKDVVESRIEL